MVDVVVGAVDSVVGIVDVVVDTVGINDTSPVIILGHIYGQKSSMIFILILSSILDIWIIKTY